MIEMRSNISTVSVSVMDWIYQLKAKRSSIMLTMEGPVICYLHEIYKKRLKKQNTNGWIKVFQENGNIKKAAAATLIQA